MKTRKVLSILLAVIFVICIFSGCGKNQGTDNPDASEQSGSVAATNVKLLYCSNDTFNPYTLITKVNMELCQLLYEPLIKLNNNFEPIYALAKDSSANGNVWTVNLKSAKFSDGTTVTGEDIIYSFNLAKKSAYFSSSLAHVSSISSTESTVTFTLSYNDAFFINVLDFPIIKKDSDNIRNEDSVLAPPIGAGRYVLNQDQTQLVRNASYFGTAPRYETISLINAPDSESVAHYVEVGATDFYYANINDGHIIRMDGKKYNINQNRLIYMGMNLKLDIFKEVKVRYALSASIDRNKIVTSAYYGNALSATGPFTPVWSQVGNYQTIETSANNKIAIENLEQIGYNILDDSGFRKKNNGSKLSFSLLINSENASQVLAGDLIASQLKEAGIQIKINALPYSQYLSALNSGNFQLYLAEVKIGNNFDISNLVIHGGSCAYGIPAPTGNGEAPDTEKTTYSELNSIITKYREGNVSISEVITTVSAQMPFIPICYRSGILFYSDSMGEIKEASSGDLFISLQS